MQFDSVYTMRMYELMSGQTIPLEFSFEQLKKMFCVEDKYNKANDFKRWVLDVAKKELDECSPYSFNYIDVKEGRKVVGFKLFPIYKPEKQDKELIATEHRSKVTARLQLDSNVYDYFRYSFEFRSEEINKNKKTLIEGQNRIPDFIGFLSELKKGARLADNPKEYVIGAIKKKLNEI